MLTPTLTNSLKEKWSESRRNYIAQRGLGSSVLTLLCSFFQSKIINTSSVPCCFTSTETVRNIEDGEPRTTATLTAQFLSSAATDVDFTSLISTQTFRRALTASVGRCAEIKRILSVA